MKRNAIGLPAQASEELVLELNQLLSNFHIYYQNLRSFHWNVRGAQFFELHLKFEELYTLALQRIDEVAERILALGGAPHSTFSAYLAESKIRESDGKLTSSEMVQSVIDALGTLLITERKSLDLAQKMGDEGTASLLGDYISEQEKLIWMLQSYLRR
ncbi:MAG TPA: Dps family protein [Luteibaculaceae bacterium]|nr:Dps family protein [Luteibaculaceae bacterium]